MTPPAFHVIVVGKSAAGTKRRHGRADLIWSHFDCTCTYVKHAMRSQHDDTPTHKIMRHDLGLYLARTDHLLLLAWVVPLLDRSRNEFPCYLILVRMIHIYGSLIRGDWSVHWSDLRKLLPAAPKLSSIEKKLACVGYFNSIQAIFLDKETRMEAAYQQFITGSLPPERIS